MNVDNSMNQDQKIELLVSELAILLIQQESILLTAESCTGGWLAKFLTDMPGSSAWFEGGVVTYSNTLKHKLLKVPVEILETKGSVSEATAEAMAMGACKLGRGAKTRLGLSITGVAGPGGGTSEKPVGTVCFGWARRTDDQEPEILRSESRFFIGDRDEIRKQSVHHALKQIVKILRSEEI